jgi:hypothetical protein
VIKSFPVWPQDDITAVRNSSTRLRLVTLSSKYFKEEILNINYHKKKFLLKTNVFWDLHCTIEWIGANVSEEATIYLFRILLYPEDGGSKFFRNVSTHLPHYKVSHTRR